MAALRTPLSRLVLIAGLGVIMSAGPDAAQMVRPTTVTGTMGTATVDGQQYYRISMRPDIPLGNWGLALDIELFIDEQGHISARGWEFDTSTRALDSFLRKLYYVRYGQPFDPVYARVGALENVTLGHGLIMKDYRNNLQYPGIKKTGLVFSIDDMAGSGLNLEGMVNNFQDLKEGGALIGLRVSRRTLGKLELGITGVFDLDQYSGLIDGDGDGYPDAVDAFPDDKDLALDNDRDGIPDGQDMDDDNNGVIDVDEGSGLPSDIVDDLLQLNAAHGDAVFPVDRQVSRQRPFNRDKVGADRFGILGLDLTYPLVADDHLAVKAYGQVAVLMDDDDELTAQEAEEQGVFPGDRKAEGWGLAAPGVWCRLGPLQSQLEFRHFRDDFDSDYFDNLYELDRARLDVASGRARSKDAQLGRSQALSGVYGSLSGNIARFLRASGSYQYLTGGDDPKQQLTTEARLSDRFLANVPRMTAARAYYQKNNIGARLNEDGTDQDGFFESTEDTFYGYGLQLEVAGDVSLIWDTRYVFERDADSHLQRQKILTIQTVFGL